MKLSPIMAVVVTAFASRACFAFEVFLNTNSPEKVSRGSEFFDKEEWRDAAKAVDGFWYVGQGMTKPPNGISISKARQDFIRGNKEKKWIVEIQGRVIAGMGEGTHHTVHEVKAMKEAGIEGFSAMVYREDRNKDSTLTVADVAAAREGMKSVGVPATPIIVNTRAFHRNELLQELVKKDLIDGFSMEAAAHLVREGKILEAEFIPGIKFAVKNKKDIYLLLAAAHSKNMLEDIQDIFKRLRHGAGKELESPHVKIVISAYDGGIKFTPDREKNGDYANTTSGAALWLCAEADKHKLRDSSHADK
jgi:hypothetical protein